MKAILLGAFFFVASFASFAQKKDWKQLENFHSIMAKSYHPVEEGNLQPLKDNVDSLVLRAREWVASTAPVGYDQKQLKPKLDKLVKDCMAVKEAVSQNKPDGVLKKLITSAHSTFHEIMEKGEEHEHK